VFLALADDPFTERAGRKMNVTEGKRWANISNSIGIVTAGQTSPTFRVEHKGIVNSINTCVISTSDTQAAAYFTGVSSKQTARLARHTTFTRQHNNCTLQIKDTDGTIRTLSLSRDKGRTSITTNQRR
jgi:ribosomal protein S14